MYMRPSDWKYQEQKLENKTVVISGGTTGIGRATALLFAGEGARVLIFGRHEPELRDALRDGQAVGEVTGLTADQARADDVRQVFNDVDRRLGSVDILVNNAAIPGGSVISDDFDQIGYTMASNFFGYLACAREAITRMRSSGGGHIVNIGSLSSEPHAPGGGVYAATKGAIRSWSESLSRTVFDDGIKVSLIEPGNVGTDFRGQQPRQTQLEREEQQHMLTAEDIAECIRYCAVQPTRCDVSLVQIRPHRQMT
jgi:NAD(P)-dependent dehydrogenase (short-subunit alcohol dehydrogenase family)